MQSKPLFHLSDSNSLLLRFFFLCFVFVCFFLFKTTPIDAEGLLLTEKHGGG